MGMKQTRGFRIKQAANVLAASFSQNKFSRGIRGCPTAETAKQLLLGRMYISICTGWVLK